MISKQEVKHIAELARIGLTAKEVEKMQKELAGILDFVEILNKADVKDIEPLESPVLDENVWRDDKAVSENAKIVDEIIEQAPDKQDRFVKVKEVLT